MLLSKYVDDLEEKTRNAYKPAQILQKRIQMKRNSHFSKLFQLCDQNFGIEVNLN